jgi:hypothetical protein
MGCGFFRQAYKELRVSDSIGFKIERGSTCPTGGKLIHRLPSQINLSRYAIALSVVVLGTVLLLRHVKGKADCPVARPDFRI